MTSGSEDRPLWSSLAPDPGITLANRTSLDLGIADVRAHSNAKPTATQTHSNAKPTATQAHSNATPQQRNAATQDHSNATPQQR